MFGFIGFFIKVISFKFDPFKIKDFVDLLFVIAEKIIVKLPRLLDVYLSFYDEMIQNEIKLANITNKDKILHIGSGCIPASSILLSDKTNANIVTIDINKKSIKNAKKLILYLKKEDKIQIKYGSSTSFKVDDFDIIIISQGIKPFEKTMRYISENIRKDAKVIFRSSSITGELSDRDNVLKNYFKIKDMVFNKKNGPLVSYLLTKK